jgi:SHS2 domain-containing protein
MKQFETIDISGDAGIRAFGSDLKELFVNAGIGMYSLVTDMQDIAETMHISVAARCETLEGLFVAWLNELIFQFDTYGFVGKRISITGLTDTDVSATLSGEEFDPARHEQRLLIKAATYHRLVLEKRGDHWQAEVIFDI